ncbi:hypothetical protein [Flavobacterium caeni]|uniref:Uncharacterized protein n=1 Tax=Flavobacterium caeni TaxID=490189 RepID=A0A1G5KKP3_9FLAO|nr:hypothetical protein [Flavobacterium caeni]SCZ01182.1 hypothetical protein SAMN02927903_03357 [Flavobacterium caeni]
MKNIAIIIFLIFTNFLFSQSKEETKEWIIEKYNNYERVNQYNQKFDLTFEEDYLIYEYLGSLFKLKIKDIKKIELKKERFDNDDKEGWVSIYIYFQKGKLSTKGLNENVFSNAESDTSFKIPLSSELINEGYKDRMEKAIIHLVKLYGGNATIKKEAF